MSSSLLSFEIFTPLYNLLKASPLDKITISNIITQQWNCFKVQTEEEDIECLMKILKEMDNENINEECRGYLKSLQNNDQMRFIRTELVSLKDMGFLRGKFEEDVNWKALALNSISLLKDKIKKGEMSAHEHIFTRVSNIDVDNLSNDDPLCIGIIDLSSDKYNIAESDFKSLVGEKANIRNLSKDIAVKNICYDFISKRNEVHKWQKFVLSSREVVTHDQWVEDDYTRKHITSEITNVLLQEIKLDTLQRVSRGSENTLVEIIACLIDTAMYHLPVDFEVEVTRSERQSIASKNRKVQQRSGSRGDKPDIMIHAYLRQKWEEIVFFESGKWDSNDDKINHDHNKLVQLYLDGSKELVKRCTKEAFYRNYIGFCVNIAEEQISKLVAENNILRQENTEIKSENVKLKQALEEHESRFKKLEQNDKNTTTENAELKARVAKLEQRQLQNDEKNDFIAKSDGDIREIKQHLVCETGCFAPNITSTKTENSNNTHDTPASDITDKALGSDACQETKTKSSEDKLRDQELLSTPKNTIPNIYQISESKSSIISSSNQEQSAISSEIKIPYNQKVEQGLMHELSEFIDEKSLSNSISDKRITENMLDENDLVLGSASYLAHLFDKAKKTGQKEILCWYYYCEEFEKKVRDISSKNEINDQMARTQIYNEMEPYLPGIKREYLRKKTQKARNIYTLFKEIGIDKIKQITYSADAISSLTGVQIQNIINRFPKKNAHVIEPSISNDSEKLLETEVSASSNPTRDCAYFRNKTLKQYPNLCQEGSDGNNDYYGITDESLCPICKSDHYEDKGIEGRYKCGSYFIKCEQRGIKIEITA
nr:7425_t:CDS:2 [Entrophospora candida]